MKKYTDLTFSRIVIVLLIFPTMLHAQLGGKKLKFNDSSQTHIIRLKSGKKIKGTITSIKNENVSIQQKDEDELLQLTLTEIRKIRIKDDLLFIPKYFESELPPALQLFFTNTAFSMKEGDRNYRTYWGNSMAYTKQVSDYISFGFGFSFPFFLHTKMKVTGETKNKNRRHGGQLGFALTPIGFTDGDVSGYVIELSQMNTWGTPDKFFNLTFNFFENGVEDFSGGFGRDERVFLKRYFGVALGGGLRIGEDLQVLINENINFSNQLIDFNLLPSIGFRWIVGKHHIEFGYMSSNNIGFNFYPLFDSDFNDFILMEKGFFSKLPFFSYARIF